jgi:hypothetical protein
VALPVLLALLAVSAHADPYYEGDFQTAPNVMTVLISHSGDFTVDDEGDGSTLTMVILGMWASELGFPDLIFNPQFPQGITAGIADPGNQVRFLGFFDTGEVVHQIQDAPPGNPGAIDPDVQIAISMALFNIHLFIGAGDFGVTTANAFVNFIVDQAPPETVTFNEVANVLFNNTGGLMEGDGFSEAEGVVFPFVPTSPLGTFPVQVTGSGAFTSSFVAAPEPGMLVLVLIGAAAVVLHRRRRRAARVST